MSRPSLGCTSTQPWPTKPICTDSPEPLPMNVFRLTSVLTVVCRLPYQVIAACGSANVGVSGPVDSRTGGPSDMTATQPVPASDML